MDHPEAAADPIVLRFERVSKIFCGDFDLARTYAVREMFGLKPRSGSALRAGEWVAVRDVSFTARRGETLVVLGSRGSGKTTIARLIAGILKPDAGRVEVVGRVGVVGAARAGMNPFMTVWEYVQLLTALHGIEPARADEVGGQILDGAELTAVRDVRIADLSKNALRHLSVGASLAAARDIHVFDEALRFGDGAVAERYQARIDGILNGGTAVVLLSGVRPLPPRIDRVLILHDGEIIYEGHPETAIPAYQQLLHVLRKSERTDSLFRRSARSDAAGDRPNAARAADLVRRVANRSDDSKFTLVMEDRITRAWASGRPILLGPYISDVGFELLYWVPFLAWMKAEYGGRDDRPVVAISRGRVGDWYAHVVSRYVDVCDLMPFAAFRERNEQRMREAGGTKQALVSDFEREILDRVTHALQLGEVEVIHPSMVFRMVGRVLRGRVASGALGARARFARFAPPAPPAPGTTGAPGEYIAASFWFNAYFRETPAHRDAVGMILREASRRLPVLLLDSEAFLAGASDLPDGGRGILPKTTMGRGDDDLGAQARLIAGARAFVGTFGGPSLATPFYDVPALAVHADESGFFGLHAARAREAAAALDASRFRIASINALDAAGVASWIDGVLIRGAR